MGRAGCLFLLYRIGYNRAAQSHGEDTMASITPGSVKALTGAFRALPERSQHSFDRLRVDRTREEVALPQVAPERL